MKQFNLIFFLTGALILFFNINISSQPVALGCGERYVDEIFSTTPISVVQFGEAINYDGTTKELEMHVFLPENDTASRRPVVLLAHSVIADQSEMYPLCEEFCKRGYIAAAIDFRGGDGTATFNNYVSVGIRHMQDMKAAVRYFRNDFETDNLFRVDTNFIFVGGFSFGGIMSLHTGYWDEGDNQDPIVDSLVNVEGGLEGQSNDFLDVSSQVQGVINLSGTMLSKEWIGAGEPPVVSYHGTSDDVVSMHHALFDGLFYMDGSAEVHQEATLKNIPNYFHPVQGGGHFDIYQQTFADEYEAFKEGTFTFFKDSVLCKDFVSSLPDDIFSEEIVRIFPNPTSREINIIMDGNKSMEFFLFDRLGRLLGKWTLDANQASLDLPELDPGMYFYYLKRDDGYIQNGKLVIDNQ